MKLNFCCSTWLKRSETKESVGINRFSLLLFIVKEHIMQETNNTDRRLMSDEEIDENLEESFPASDPPSWNLGTNHAVSGTKTKTVQTTPSKQ